MSAPDGNLLAYLGFAVVMGLGLFATILALGHTKRTIRTTIELANDASVAAVRGSLEIGDEAPRLPRPSVQHAPELPRAAEMPRPSPRLPPDTAPPLLPPPEVAPHPSARKQRPKRKKPSGTPSRGSSE